MLLTRTMTIREIILQIFAMTVTATGLLIDNQFDHQLGGADRVARQLLYYSGTEVELNLVLAVPMKTGQHSVTLGFFLEANYDLPPYNSQNIYIQPLQILKERLRNPVNRARRDIKTTQIHRAGFYKTVELLIESNIGMSGRVCLLRSICEAAACSVEHDGLFGELLHVLLTPSSTAENGPLHSEYTAAEKLGRSRGSDCSSMFAACPVTPLDLISTIRNSWSPPT